MTEVRIRPALADDVPGIARVTVDVWRATFAGLLPAAFLDGLSYARQEERHARMLARPGVTYHVARTGGATTGGTTARGREVVGFASGGPSRHGALSPQSELYAIYVRPEHQGRGLGASLFGRIVRDLGRSRREGLLAMALACNPHAAFYGRHGGRAAPAAALDLGASTADQVAYLWDALPPLGEQPIT